MSADNLRDFQRQQEEKRKFNERQRKSQIQSLRASARIHELDSKIASLKREQAATRIRQRRPGTRSAIEECSAIPPTVRQDWLEQFDAVAWFDDAMYKQITALYAQAEAMEEKLKASADSLAGILPNLAMVADRREKYPSFPPQLQDPRKPARGARFDLVEPLASFGLTEFDALAEDLRPIRDQIEAADIPFGVRYGWLDQLKSIDDGSDDLLFRLRNQRVKRRTVAKPLTSSEKAKRLAKEIEQHADSVRWGVLSVTTSLSLLKSECYFYLHP